MKFSSLAALKRAVAMTSSRTRMVSTWRCSKFRYSTRPREGSTPINKRMSNRARNEVNMLPSRLHAAEIETGELPAAGQPFSHVQPAVSPGGMLPGLAANLDAAELGEFIGIGSSENQRSAIAEDEEILT